MKKIFPLLLLAGAYFAFKFGKKGIAAKNLNVKIRTLKLDPISQAAIVLEIINPTDFDISFNSIVCDLTLDNNAVSTLSVQRLTNIPANNSIEVALPIKLNGFEILLFIKDFIKAKGKVKKVGLIGNINGEGFIIPILIEQNLNA
jgi:LEA14-like dessication related protein